MTIKGHIWILCVALLLAGAFRVRAQAPDTNRKISLAYVDSVMNSDSLMKDLAVFIDSTQKPKTLLAIEMGVGNGFFTTKNAAAGTGYSTQTFYSPTITYLHKSGLGISASAYATEGQHGLTVYQGAITPSFDIGRKYWSAGISYSRYINKDSVSFGVNPLKNDCYAYGIFKKFWLEPGLALDYSFDFYKVEQFLTVTNLPPPPHVEETDYNINAHTFGLIITLQHDFEWFGLLSKNDHVAFTPTLMALSDASNYDITVIQHLKKGVLQRFANDFKKSGSGNDLTLESFGGLLDVVYNFGHFLIDPQVLGEYFVHAGSGVDAFRISYLINVGWVF